MLTINKINAYLGLLLAIIAATVAPIIKVPIKGNWNLYQTDSGLFFVTSITIALMAFVLFIRRIKAFKFFTVIEFFLVSLYLFPIIQLRIRNTIFIVFTSLFSITLLTENILIQNQGFDSISTGVSALSILIFSLTYLFSRINYNSNPENFKGYKRRIEKNLRNRV